MPTFAGRYFRTEHGKLRRKMCRPPRLLHEEVPACSPQKGFEHICVHQKGERGGREGAYIRSWGESARGIGWGVMVGRLGADGEQGQEVKCHARAGGC